MPEELWTKVCNIVEGSDQNHPQEEEMQKSKWRSEESLKVAEKRRELKGKGEKERLYPPECKVTKNSRGGKKAFLSEQCKEIEKNNRMRKARSLQENWRYQRNIPCKDGHNKGQKWQGPDRSRRD